MKKILASSLLIFLTAALLFSCKKDISKIGVDVVGENPLKVVFMDTVTVEVYSELIDTLRTDELSSHVVGAIKDPVFGTLNASLYNQFRLETGDEDHSFGTNPLLDSIVLYISYAETEVYGDTSYMQNWTVYELGDDMYRDSSYLSFENIRTKQDVLGQASFIPKFDTIDLYNYDVENIDTTRIIRRVSIPLSEELGNRLLSQTDIYASNEAFLEAFKGIYITTLQQNLPSSGGSTVNLDMESDLTYIRLYYTNDEHAAGDTLDYSYSLSFDYIVNLNTARFSNFNHYDYLDASPEFRAQVIDGNHSLGQEMVYMQGLAGVRTVIKFPHLNAMDDYYNYAVNEAKLFLYDIDDSDPKLPAIPSLTLSHQIEVDSTLNYYTISDASSGNIYFSGKYVNEDMRYYFRITQYIQDLIQGKTYDNKMRLEIIGGAVHPNRLVAAGSEPMMNEEKKVKLQITYTKIDNDK